MRRGLVFGKFMPLHRGHQLLIDRALAQTDDVTIVVYDSEPPGAYPPMPLEKRLGWLERLYPQAEAIVPVADPLRDAPDADDPRHAAAVRGNGARSSAASTWCSRASRATSASRRSSAPGT